MVEQQPGHGAGYRCEHDLHQHAAFLGRQELPAAQTRDKSAVSVSQMQQIVADLLEEGFTFILIDCPAGIEQGFRNATAGATEAIVSFRDTE